LGRSDRSVGDSGTRARADARRRADLT
jgi:hypothetical protein